MLDDTPAPLGDVTRRWSHLDDECRERHATRLLGLDCPGNQIAHVETPKVDDGVCYRRVVKAAIAGDPIALGLDRHDAPTAARQPRTGTART